MDAPVALPLAEHLDANNYDWMYIEEDDFMEKYGDAVRERYKFPTEEELLALAEAEDGYFSDDEDTDGDDSDSE
jgi:hypothetical protein